MEENKRLVFITHSYLDNNGGGCYASRAYANAFAELYDECLLIYPDRGVSVRSFISNKYKIHGVRYNKNKILKLFDIYQGKIHRYDNNVLKMISAFRADVVVFDHSQCSYRLISIIKDMGIKVITIHHNYESEYFKDNPPHILVKKIMLKHVVCAERNSVMHSDLNLTLTKQDSFLFKKNYIKKNRVSIEEIGCFEANKITDRISLLSSNDNVGLTFLITGSLSAVQTEKSLTIFLKECYHTLVCKFPNLELIIAGKDPSEDLKKVCSELVSVTLICNPANMSDVVKEADVYVCPVSLGGGLKLRIMDGLRAGLPVIAHSVSARGYDFFVEEGVMYSYNNVDSFIKALDNVIHLLHSKKIGKQEIQDLYLDTFSFESGVKRLECLLKKYAFL